jgi:hypothetical protein
MDLLYFAIGGALISALVRWWRPDVSWKTAAAFLALTGAFYAVPLATPAVQGSYDIAYRLRPWSETVPEKVQPGNPLLSDIPFFILPLHVQTRDRLLRLEAPLWSHEMGTGQPLLASAQGAPFAPLHLMARPLPPVRGLTVAVAWQMLLMLLLTYALILGLGGGRAGAVLAALAFTFSTYNIAWAYHPLPMVAAWFPGVVLGMVLLRRGERGGMAGLVACAYGVATGGHPETLAHIALGCAVFAVALLIVREGIPRGRFLARLSAAAALTACLTAPAVLPILEALPESERWVGLQHDSMGVQPPPFEPRLLLLLADPLLFGSPRDGNWAGPSNFNETCSLYAGLVTLGLALAGAAVLRGRVAWMVAAGFAALLAGMRAPLFFDLVEALPGLEHAAHARMRLLWVLPVAVAAGLSLEPLLGELRDRRRAALAATMAVVAAVGAVLGIVLVSSPPDHPWQQAWAVVTLAGLGGLLLALAMPRLRPAAPWIAIGVVALDLALLSVRFHPVLPPEQALEPPPVLLPLMAEARAAGPFRVTAEDWDLTPNLGAVYGLWDPRGSDPMRPAGPARLIGRRYGSDYTLGRPIRLDLRRDAQAMHDYLGVRYLLTRHRRKMPPPWELVGDDTGGRVWRNPRALPLFFFPAEVRERADPERVFWWTLLNRDFAALAWVDSAEGRKDRRQSGNVRLLAVRSNGFDLETASPTGGIAVSSVSHAKGWRVEIDGRPGVLRRVNSAFLGFEVPPGRHRVRLDYRPRSWTIGLWLAAAGILAAVLAPLAARYRGGVRPTVT